ncbi:hypothetical protein QVD17_32241 [Tagetes erecta]|uniref:RING-type domain-containing protein n=1 Tax=Tagetes erecta TaxID=13708 RepID=A0AAD8K4V7_TARER|nr:hypothetical protein QVD17_32241 [Tagetes erecta]
MAVQAQLYSDHYQNCCYNNPNNTSQDWLFISDENRVLCSSSSYEHQDPRFVNDFSSERKIGMFSSYGFQNLSSELERQRLEMDCFLQFQNEKLKAVLNEETRKREIMMMQSYELKMKAIINEKDEALNTARNRATELQNYLTMAEKEAENWEKKAMETEAMVIELNTKIKQARARRHEDAESICNGDDDDERQKQRMMVCKVCHVRSTCVLLLPCRHLCCCRGCEGLLMFCPVCETVKNGSLEVIFETN